MVMFNSIVDIPEDNLGWFIGIPLLDDYNPPFIGYLGQFVKSFQYVLHLYLGVYYKIIIPYCHPLFVCHFIPHLPKPTDPRSISIWNAMLPWPFRVKLMSDLGAVWIETNIDGSRLFQLRNRRYFILCIRNIINI